MEKRLLYMAFSALAVMVLISLACTQSGEILTPEQATQRVQATEEAKVVEINQQAESAELNNGDAFQFVGTGFLVPIYPEAGARMQYSNASRGDEGVIISSEVVEGQLWYEIDSGAGEGWVPAESVEPIESTSEDDEDQDNFLGKTVYLTGKGFLVNLRDEPGSLTIKANQQRGAEVEVLKKVVKEGTNWYLIDAPTGEGWVPEENLSLENPN